MLSGCKAGFLPSLWSPSKTQKHLAKAGANRYPGTACVTRGRSPHLQACILQPLGVSGVGLIDTVPLGSGFPYADAHYVICPVYLHSLWGPFCCCARLGLKIHVSLFKSIRIHIQSMCNTSRGLPLLNKFTDLPLTFILVIYIKSFSRRIEALLYTAGCMNGSSRKLKSIVLSDSISVRCSADSRVREPRWTG